MDQGPHSPTGRTTQNTACGGTERTRLWLRGQNVRREPFYPRCTLYQSGLHSMLSIARAQAPLLGRNAECARQDPPFHGRRIAHEPAGQHLRRARLSRTRLPQEPLARTRAGYDPHPSVPQGEPCTSISTSERTQNASRRRTSPPESSSSRASGARSRTCPAHRATPRNPTLSSKTCLALVSGATRHPSVPARYRSRLRQGSRMGGPVVVAAATLRRPWPASGARYTPPGRTYTLCTTHNSMLTLRGILLGRKQHRQEHERSFIHIPLPVREGLRLVLFGYGFAIVLRFG